MRTKTGQYIIYYYPSIYCSILLLGMQSAMLFPMLSFSVCLPQESKVGTESRKDIKEPALRLKCFVVSVLW